MNRNQPFKALTVKLNAMVGVAKTYDVDWELVIAAPLNAMQIREVSVATLPPSLREFYKVCNGFAIRSQRGRSDSGELSIYGVDKIYSNTELYRASILETFGTSVSHLISIGTHHYDHIVLDTSRKADDGELFVGISSHDEPDYFEASTSFQDWFKALVKQVLVDECHPLTDLPLDDPMSNFGKIFQMANQTSTLSDDYQKISNRSISATKSPKAIDSA